MATKGATGKPLTKSQILNALAEGTGLTKKEVGSVLDGLATLIETEIGKKGPGVFNLPGLLKIQKQHKPATKARKMISPFSGEEITVKPKPARNVVKVRPLKGLKEMV